LAKAVGNIGQQKALGGIGQREIGRRKMPPEIRVNGSPRASVNTASADPP
jgi:hypothetical protein